MKNTSIMIVGVGGQGTLLASRISQSRFQAAWQTACFRATTDI